MIVWVTEEGTVKRIKLIGAISEADADPSERTFTVDIGY